MSYILTKLTFSIDKLWLWLRIWAKTGVFFWCEMHWSQWNCFSCKCETGHKCVCDDSDRHSGSPTQHETQTQSCQSHATSHAHYIHIPQTHHHTHLQSWSPHKHIILTPAQNIITHTENRSFFFVLAISLACGQLTSCIPLWCKCLHCQ